MLIVMLINYAIRTANVTLHQIRQKDDYEFWVGKDLADDDLWLLLTKSAQQNPPSHANSRSSRLLMYPQQFVTVVVMKQDRLLMIRAYFKVLMCLEGMRKAAKCNRPVGIRSRDIWNVH